MINSVDLYVDYHIPFLFFKLLKIFLNRVTEFSSFRGISLSNMNHKVLPVIHLDSATAIKSCWHFKAVLYSAIAFINNYYTCAVDKQLYS